MLTVMGMRGKVVPLPPPKKGCSPPPQKRATQDNKNETPPLPQKQKPAMNKNDQQCANCSLC